MKKLSLAILAFLIFSCSESSNKTQQNTEYQTKETKSDANQLNLWNGPIKQAILNSLNAVPDSNKVIAFDMDGTLISEYPSYYMVDLLKQNDAIHGKDIAALISGLKEFMSRPNYYDLVKSYVDANEAKVYAPMNQLLDYLKEENFTLVMSTGSPIELAEAVCKKQFPQFDVIIGSKLDGDSLNINDQEGKVANLKAQNIRPAIVFGNSHGDFAMMEYSKAANFLVLHDDQVNNEFDKPEEYKKECLEKGITAISIKDDWVQVFK